MKTITQEIQAQATDLKSCTEDDLRRALQVTLGRGLPCGELNKEHLIKQLLFDMHGIKPVADAIGTWSWSESF